MKAVNPFTLIALAVASGATTPVPSGGAGSLIWSTTTGGPLVWTGSQWTGVGTGAGTGDILGPASATDNAIVRYDTTTGELVQNSAATVSDDGVIRSATNSGANAVSVPLCNWVMQTADRTLTSTTSVQKLFDTTTNGTLTLPTGVYKFHAFLYLTGMSGTSGNLSFKLLGGGTATMGRIGYTNFGIDAASPLAGAAQTGSGAVTEGSEASIVSATTSTGLIVTSEGMFRISAAGTIVPSVALVTAAAATVKAGTFFCVEKVGESSETYLGAWT